MERLTDRKTAAELKKNADGLRAAGLEPSEMDKRYIKLAEYEDHDEVFENMRKEWIQENGHCNDFYPREIYITQKEGD